MSPPSSARSSEEPAAAEALRAFPPTFVACTARSGSTLLRWLIDAHPDVACPGETDLAVLLNSYVQIASSLSGRRQGVPSAKERGRAVADDLMGTSLAGTDKRRWCDKSLSNVFHLDLLASTWPEARFILLYRDCMDMVISGIEASPWGLAEYGFDQVARMSPTDSVVALAAYWVDRTTRMLDFEARFAERCYRLRYEDLVAHTDEILEGLWDFIGVGQVAGVAAAAFEREHSTLGPADHKVWYTGAVHRESVGQGARVPPDHVSGPLRATVNQLLERLDYPTIDDTWGSGRAPLAGEPSSNAGDAARIELRVLEGHELVQREMFDLPTTKPSQATPDVAPSVGATRGTPFVVVVERRALRGVCDHTINLGAAMRDRLVRYYGPLPSAFKDELEVFEHVLAFLIANSAALLAPGTMSS